MAVSGDGSEPDRHLEADPDHIADHRDLFAILFGLSMDYEVFLLSRIKEEYDRTGDNAQAVADGLAKSARVITAGAAIMVTVFIAFVLGHDVMAKMLGIGLAAAVLVDATLVRMVLVPATMELLGDRNWWLPGWLDRILPRIDGRRRRRGDSHPDGIDTGLEPDEDARPMNDRSNPMTVETPGARSTIRTPAALTAGS